MKYANQVNLALAVAGLVIVVYAFSITFLSGPPPLALDLDRLAELAESRAEPVSRGRVMMRNAATTGSLPADGGTGRFSQGRSLRSSQGIERAPVGAGSGLVGGGSGARGQPSGRRSLGAQRMTSPSQSTVGRPPGRFGTSADPQVEPEEPTQSGLIPPSPADRAGAMRQRPRTVQPAPGAEAQKRTQSDQTGSPPFRSSMSNRRF